MNTTEQIGAVLGERLADLVHNKKAAISKADVDMLDQEIRNTCAAIHGWKSEFLGVKPIKTLSTPGKKPAPSATVVNIDKNLERSVADSVADYFSSRSEG
jgi:hypothetical protein